MILVLDAEAWGRQEISAVDESGVRVVEVPPIEKVTFSTRYPRPIPNQARRRDSRRMAMAPIATYVGHAI